MNGTLGRDKVWNDHIWSEIDKAVRDEMGRIRVAQKVFPSTIVNNVLPVLVNAVPPPVPATSVPAILRTGDDEFRPFIEMSIQFVLTQAQVDGEENMRLAPTLARLAASALASAEDALLFLGPGSIVAGSIPPFIGTGVTVTNLGAFPDGFVAETGFLGVTVNGATATLVGDIIGAVARGIANLSGRAQTGPYALFLPPNRYAQTFSPQTVGALQTPGDSIKYVVTGGFYMVNSLTRIGSPPNDIGILVSLGGEPTKIILGIDATTALAFINPQGDYHFRVFERIQLVVREPAAFEALNFPLSSPP